MKYSVKYGTKNIEFNVEFKDRKTMSISVEPHKKITVVAPVGTSEKEIKESVKSKGAWIVQKLFEFRKSSKARRYRRRAGVSYLSRALFGHGLFKTLE